MRALIFYGISLMGLVTAGYFVWTVTAVRETTSGPGGVVSVVLKKVAVGQIVPDFIARDTKQSLFELSGSRKTKIVNFWASWCGPCLLEIPSMAALARKRPNDLEVIAISCDSVEKDFLRALSLFPDFTGSGTRIVFDPDKRLMRAYGVTGFPESFIVSPDGRLIKKIIGPLDWTNLPADFFGTMGEH